MVRVCVPARSCIQPYMPEHNSQQLLYAAMNTGQLALAEQQAQVAVDFPKQYGPTVMADGGSLVAHKLVVPLQMMLRLRVPCGTQYLSVAVLQYETRHTLLDVPM